MVQQSVKKRRCQRVVIVEDLWPVLEHKEIGAIEISVLIIELDGLDPLLYTAKKTMGSLQLTEDEARTTARQAYENNPRLTSFEIGQAVDSYIADLRALFQMDLDLKILRMNGLHIPQERMANRLGLLNRLFLSIYKKCRNWQNL
jgi:hypothetical protein